MSIELRPHQIVEIRLLSRGKGPDIKNLYGKQVQTVLENIIRQIDENPSTEIKIVGSHGALCIAECLQRPSTYDFCEGIGTDEFEKGIAEKLGVEIGQVYEARKVIFS